MCVCHDACVYESRSRLVSVCYACFCASFDRPDVYSVLNEHNENLASEEDQKVSNMSNEHDNSIHIHLQNEQPTMCLLIIHTHTSTLSRTNKQQPHLKKEVLYEQFEQAERK